MSWCVKVKRYGGGTSVIARFDSEAEADALAATKNAEYQTDAYYVEKWREQS